MFPLVCTWNPWGPGVRPNTCIMLMLLLMMLLNQHCWSWWCWCWWWWWWWWWWRWSGKVSSSWIKIIQIIKLILTVSMLSSSVTMIVTMIMMTNHLALHPDLSVVAGHSNLPGHSSSTESDHDFWSNCDEGRVLLFFWWIFPWIWNMMIMMMMIMSWKHEKSRHTYKQH